MTVAMTTERSTERDRPRSTPARAHSLSAAANTALIAIAGFLAVLALLALQLRSNPSSVGLATQKPRVVILRRIYETTVHERVIGAATGTTVQRSTSVAAAAAPSAPVTTHTS